MSGTNDYRAAIAGLESAQALRLSSTSIVVLTSSQLVRDQMTGERLVLGNDFLSLVRRLDYLIEPFASVAWELIPTADNLADRPARQGIPGRAAESLPASQRFLGRQRPHWMRLRARPCPK